MGRKEEILEVLKDKNLTAKEIKRDLEKVNKTEYNIELVRNYVLKLQQQELIEKVNDKREFVYRSIVNKIVLILEQIQLANLPKELKLSIYETYFALLPSYLETQLDKVIKNKTQEIKQGTYIKSEEDFEKLKNLYI